MCVVDDRVLDPGRHLASLSRQLNGLPVWSSRMLLGLTADSGIGYLQLHWPELPAHAVHEARRVAHKLNKDWQAPAREGAEVEAAEAVIVHSPAVALCMDIYPAIRVIYRSE